MPWSGHKVLRKLKMRRSSHSDACIDLPPPGPSVFKSSMQAQAPTAESSSSRRSVAFRDQRLPDGRSLASSQRPRLYSCTGSLDYSVASVQVRSSAVPPSGRLPPSGPAIPSLASYPASYQSNCYIEYETVTTRGSSNLPRPQLSNLPNFSPPRSTYDEDIPTPDYPMPPSSTSGSSFRDSGLDSDSRSSSEQKPPYSPIKRSVDYSQGWNFAQNGDPRMMPEPTMRSPLANQNYTTRIRSLTPGARQGAVCTDDGYPYGSPSRNCQYNPPRWDYQETSSLPDWSPSRDSDDSRRYPLPKTANLMNMRWQQNHEGRSTANRSRDYTASLDRAYGFDTQSRIQGRHCGSCLCLNSIRDEIGHCVSVGTNTAMSSSSDSISETLRSRSTPKRMQLAKTPLASRKEQQRSKKVSSEMTWEAVGNDDEGLEDEEEEVQDEEREREDDEPQHTVYRPAIKAPPLPVLSSSSGAGRSTPYGRPPSAASGFRLPRSQPLKGQGRMPYRTLENAARQPADSDDGTEDRQRFEPMRREGNRAADERSVTFACNLREYAPSPANRRFPQPKNVRIVVL